MDDTDLEIQAMAASSKALASLEDEAARMRVLKWLFDKYKVTIPADMTTVSSDDSDAADDAPTKKRTKAMVKASAASTSKRRAPKKTAALESLKGVNLSATVTGYPSFHSLTAKLDKFLWTLMFAKTQGLESLSNMEISQLSDRLGDGFPTNNINKNYKSNLKKGYVNRSIADNKIRLMPDGDDHLKSLLTKAKA
jgi:hypothetical protein